MSWLREFLRLRRRSGKIKLALLLFLLAAFFAAGLAESAARYAENAGRPTEYILETAMTGPLLDGALARLEELEGVVGASRQRELSLTAGEKALTVTQLSSRYLSQCWGLAPEGAGRSCWLNQAAAQGFLGGAPLPAGLVCGNGTGEESVRFLPGDPLPGGSPLAVMAGSSWELGEPGTVRVMAAPRGLAGGAGQLEALGFTLQNRELLTAQRYEEELLLTRLGYGLAALALALAAGRLLYREGKREAA